MKPILEIIHQALDEKIEKWKASGELQNVPCKSGCHHCCREPAYVERSEIRYALELLTPEQLERVKLLARVWLEKFTSNGFQFQHEPSTFDYRPQMLWCPLLKDGKCTVYERRPVCCRLHIAKDSSAGCEQDDKRKDQQFATFPGLGATLNKTLMEDAFAEGKTVLFDHLGILLCEELLGLHLPTASRLRFRPKGDTVLMENYEPKDAYQTYETECQ